jgi:DNA polymerase
MRWDDRQRAMLREMGIRVWAPREAPAGDGDAVAVEAGADAEPAPVETVARPQPQPAARTRPPEAATSSLPARAATLAPADWLIVGEPFDAVDAADLERLLDNLLAAIRVSRRSGPRAGRAEHLPLVDGAAIELDAAIAQVAPLGILALGRAAASALLGVDEPLGRLRERVHGRAGVPVVVTFSLAYLLRHSADKAKAWADLCRAVAAVG